MRILVAPDKFKGSLGAAAIAEQIAAGLREALPDAEIVLLPVADGGEGTAEVICAAAGGAWEECAVHDPLGRKVCARYCLIAQGMTAVLEMSQASGLWRLSPNERDPLRASSFGTGEMLLEAAARGVLDIIIGLGGSATNDGGMGMARALGFHFHNAEGEELGGAVSDLLHLARIVPPPERKLPRITIAADVRNPLLGPRGATRVFAAQKGAGPGQIEQLELALARLAEVTGAAFGSDFAEVPGAGAAGGLGFALMTFCGAKMRPGFDVVAEQIHLESAVRRADVIITGEGRLDAQTAEGKAPAGMARLARAYGKRVFAVVGEAEGGAEHAEFDAVYELVRPPLTRAGALGRVEELLRARARELANEQLCG